MVGTDHVDHLDSNDQVDLKERMLVFNPTLFKAYVFDLQTSDKDSLDSEDPDKIGEMWLMAERYSKANQSNAANGP